uniref:Protein elav n=1 Tax=Lygus hesperus TaxID=30085 RepID=A0A0A9YUY0_LYGHE
MDESQLYQLFLQFGPIESVKIIYDKQTHESRGYGFVKYYFFFSATYAITCLNRFTVGGKRLKVAYANVECAKDALAVVRQFATGFTPPQQLAYSNMYYGQMTYLQR